MPFDISPNGFSFSFNIPLCFFNIISNTPSFFICKHFTKFLFWSFFSPFFYRFLPFSNTIIFFYFYLLNSFLLFYFLRWDYLFIYFFLWLFLHLFLFIHLFTSFVSLFSFKPLYISLGISGMRSSSYLPYLHMDYCLHVCCYQLNISVVVRPLVFVRCPSILVPYREFTTDPFISSTGVDLSRFVNHICGYFV